MDKTEAKSAMVERLRLSGLDAAAAKRLHIVAYATDEAAELGLSVTAAGFKIPYFEPSGHVNGFYRFRLLEKPARNGFDALTERKYPKYLQPAKSPPSVYLPPLNDTNWAQMMADPGQALIITEGELKAACAVQHDFLCLGLGGVWSFRSKRLLQTFLPILNEFIWKGRSVRIVFDSDAATNPDILAAEGALARQLEARGAVVQIARIPGRGSEKVGLDDYLMAEGPQALEKLLLEAPAYASNVELHRLNEEVIYIRNPGFIVRVDNCQKITAEAFTRHQYSTRKCMVLDKDKKSKEVPAATEWLKWGGRAQAERLVYEPGQPPYTDCALNTWPGWGCQPEPGDIAPWRTLLDYLFKGYRFERRFFEQWCAYPLQHPGVKMYVTAVIWSRLHGIGKSLVGYTLKRIYGANATEINEKHLDPRASFNPWQENKQFIFGDDVASHDRRGMASLLKNMITQEEVWINLKNLPQFSIPDRANYYFTSQHADAFFIDDDDRRYFVHNPQVEAAMPQEFYREVYVPWMKSEGPCYLFHHLLNLDLDGFDPHAPAPSTEAKRAMMAAGQSALGTWVRELRDTPDNVLRMGEVINRWTLATAEELLALYDPSGRTGTTANAMAREMAKAGMKQVCRDALPLPDGRRVRLWIVRHRQSTKKPTPRWLAKIYLQERLHSQK